MQRNNAGRKIMVTARIGVLVIFLAGAVYYVHDNTEILSRIFSLGCGHIFVISAIFLANLLVDGLLFMILMSLFGIRLNFVEWFGITVLNKCGNYLLAKGGPLLRAGYLKKRHGLKIGKFILAFVFLSLVQFFCASLVLLADTAYLCRQYGLCHHAVSAISALAVLASLCAYFAPDHILLKLTDKFEKISGLARTWVAMKRDIRPILRLIILTFVSIFLSAVRINFIYGAVFGPIPLAKALIMVATGSLATLISFTPGALGIKELMMAYVAQINGENFVETVAVATMDRVIAIIWIFTFGFYFMIVFAKRGLKLFADNKEPG